ncbi:MAG: hypothetical protein ACI4W7_00065 [Candidatus Spyradenecus sp.]
MKATHISWIWSVAVFAVATVFYLLTSAWGAYPGASAQFVALTLFPEWGLDEGVHSLEQVLALGMTRLLAPERLLAGCSWGAAILGGLTILGLFRATMAGISLSCVDMNGIRAHEMGRMREDLWLVMLLTGLGTALAGLVALPLWAQGTRPLAGGVATTLGMALICFALRLRRRCIEDLEGAGRLTFRHQVLLAGVFALAAYLGVDVVQLAPVALVGMVLGASAFVRAEGTAQAQNLLWAAIGVVAGVVASMVTYRMSLALAGVETEMSLGVLWVNRVMAAWKGALPWAMSFEGASALILFALPMGLYFGCFPQAYLKFASPLIGQLVILLALGTCLTQWPEALWETLAEPTALSALGMAMLICITGMMVGSWASNWLDVHTRWKPGAAHGVATVMVMGSLCALAGAEGWLWHDQGAGRPAQEVCREVWKAQERSVPAPAQVWLEAPWRGVEDFLVWRHTQGRTLYPVRVGATKGRNICLGDQMWEAWTAADLAFARLQTLPKALEQYLAASPWRQFVLSGELPLDNEREMVAVVRWAEGTPFGQTPVGRRFLEGLLARAARSAVTRAYALLPAEAAERLREALIWDAKNLAAVLSLAALTEEGVAVSQAERVAGVAVLEREPWLQEPSPRQASAFEAKYGPVRNAAFRSARRMGHLESGNREAMLSALCKVYEENPQVLSAQERLAALLAAGEAAGAEHLQHVPAQPEELELYLLAYPLTEASRALYQTYRETLKENSALTQIYNTRYGVNRDRLRDRILSFFSRDGHFAYALFYVNNCLAQGDLEEAEQFVTGFSFRERMAEMPYFAETLRVRVLEKIAERDQPKAVATARDWLLSDPKQPAIWRFLFEHEPKPPVEDILACLADYPHHSQAAAWFADYLHAEAGEEAALRWKEACKRAQVLPLK